MSIDEMRSFCESIQPFQLRVQFRLRDGHQTFEGKITDVGAERFQLQTDNNGINELRYAWVSGINQTQNMTRTYNYN